METVPLERFHYLLHPYPTVLVTCIGSGGRPNIVTVAWLIPVSVDPPLVAMSLRPSRHSYSLLAESGEFVVNVSTYASAADALHCGRRTGRTEDKFKETGLTPTAARRVRPPIISECPAHLECRIVSDLEAGDHRLLVAEVIDAYARPGFTGSDGLRDVGRAAPLLHLGRNRFVDLAGHTIEPAVAEER
jgi:flavin reductase (DIM6/NTAB) family NADH-FMN oxidoreductase RutF